ncbi:MAG: hypothetical protein AAF355_06970 [Myxococcota bacterium]
MNKLKKIITGDRATQQERVLVLRFEHFQRSVLQPAAHIFDALLAQYGARGFGVLVAIRPIGPKPPSPRMLRELRVFFRDRDPDIAATAFAIEADGWVGRCIFETIRTVGRALPVSGSMGFVRSEAEGIEWLEHTLSDLETEGRPSLT